MSRPRNLLVKNESEVLSVSPRNLKAFLIAKASGNAGAVLTDAKLLTTEGVVVVTALGPESASQLLGALFPTETASEVVAVNEAAREDEVAETPTEVSTVATA